MSDCSKIQEGKWNFLNLKNIASPQRFKRWQPNFARRCSGLLWALL